MKFIDISWPIANGVTEYKDKNTIKIKSVKTFSKNKVRDSIFTMGTHTGTHVDAPSHFLKEGGNVNTIPIEKLCGECVVLSFPKIKDCITSKELEKYTLRKDDIVLLRTKNSSLSPTTKFNPNFIYLEKSGAKLLAEKGVKAVGIDYLGIERNQPQHETHEVLLGNKIFIIEGLRLGKVKPGRYKLICLPLSLRGVEASPCRAVLMKK